MENTTLRQAFDRWLKAIRNGELDDTTIEMALKQFDVLANKFPLFRVLVFTFKQSYGVELNANEMAAFFLAVADVQKAIDEALEEELMVDDE